MASLKNGRGQKMSGTMPHHRNSTANPTTPRASKCVEVTTRATDPATDPSQRTDQEKLGDSCVQVMR
eukprot:CAMPEP_0204363904 /NCGR_PEP_ID=MMETSP0469-20131031/40714_1 /ASSEMBLY_ACC=CAM_ASM_000384 /TAXON_ID=2969 /ORGANISM="Oxyrrhis marina" /LENGTH=66 /DNA_ID=CAMNT_0051352707 /DNA_START=103 /DNA_END=299 /DNA_ORIENTATION=+